MAAPRAFRSFDEFEREYIRPGWRVGQTVEDLLEDAAFERDFELENDAFEEDEDDDDY
jgi:hypothetical protein